jgi:predicted nucleic acid-binding protein
MAAVVGSSILMDFLRTGSSPELRRQTKTILIGDDRFICEPVAFELLRAVSKHDRAHTEALTDSRVRRSPFGVRGRGLEFGVLLYSVFAAVHRSGFGVWGSEFL